MLSRALSQLITILAVTFPAEADVASVFVKAFTETVTSLYPVAVIAAEAIFLMSSSVMLFDTSSLSNSFFIASLTAITFSAEVFSGSTTGFCTQCAYKV